VQLSLLGLDLTVTSTGLDHGILRHCDGGLQRLFGAGSTAERWWPSALLRCSTGRPCSGRATPPRATCCSGGCARWAALYSAARSDFSVMPSTAAALESFRWAGACWDCTWHVNTGHHRRTFQLAQGSDVDLGLPPVAQSASKARRRPLDILEQSEQPRVCFQVNADAMRCQSCPVCRLIAACRGLSFTSIREAGVSGVMLILQCIPPCSWSRHCRATGRSCSRTIYLSSHCSCR
jgi:hypothetical protein